MLIVKDGNRQLYQSGSFSLITPLTGRWLHGQLQHFFAHYESLKMLPIERIVNGSKIETAPEA